MVSKSCTIACQSALFAPSLSHEMKQNRIQTICNAEGDDVNKLLFFSVI